MVKCVSEKEGCSFIELPNTHCLHSLFHGQDADITQFTEFPNTGPIITKSSTFTFAYRTSCSLISSSGVGEGGIQLVFQKPKSKDTRK